jgi:hypothetical protein
MTPKEKARQIVFKIYDTLLAAGNLQCYPEAKQCALIAVDEIINANPTGEYGDPFIDNHTYDNKGYWTAVKQEINNISW